MQEERILLGSWLLGYNTEDIEKFEESDFFKYPMVYRLLKAGSTALQISRQLQLPISELAKMQSEYSFSFYIQIVEQWVKEKIFKNIANLSPKDGKTADVEEIKNSIDYNGTPCQDTKLIFYHEPFFANYV